MGLMTDAAVVNIEGNTKQLVDQINKADKAMQNFDKTLTDILSHLTAVENGLKNVNSITNNANKITNNVQTRYNRETYDFGKQSKIVKSSSGFMSSDTGSEKAFRDYQQAVIDETKEITADIAERKRLRKQRADAETTTANAAKLRASKLEDQTSARYLARMDKLADARLLNAKNNQTGALYRDPRYQAGKAFSAVGNTVSTWGVGGKAVGLLLDSLGAFVKSPVAGTAVAVSNLVKGVSELGKASTQAFAEIEAIKTQMGVVYSSQTQANSAFSEISQYAVKSPFGIQQTSELAILLKQSGVYASDLMDTLKMLGDTAGGNMEKMKRIANNYAQIMAIGKASMLDMRQFAYAGIPIFEAVSKELGVSQQELRKLISDGKVTSDIIEKVFKDLTGINGVFENATEKGAKTLKARLQNLADARQLAFSSIGERIYNIGTETGNDSYANRMVSAAENIWQGLHDWFDRGNIAKNVETIANRNSRIDELKQLIEYNKDNKDIKKLLEEELKEELSKRDVEKDRATYVSSYDSKAGRFKNALDALNGYSIDDAYGRRSSLLWKDSLIGLFNNRQEYNNLDIKETTKLFGLYNELIKALEELPKLSEQDIQANRERNILQAQQLAYDQMNHYANARGSLNNSFQELSALYKESDEYKQKEEKEHLATLKNALEILKDIAKNTDENGRVDITKFSANQLASYIKQGAFTSGEKLDVVTGNKTVDSQNRRTLMNQYGYIAKLTDNFLKTGMAGVSGIQGTTYAQSFNQEILDSLNNLSDEQFFTEFPKIYKQQSNAINEMIRVAPKDGRQQQLETFKILLDYALTKFEADTTGTGADPNDILKGTKQEFIPLWKRILAQYTGLSTTGMTSTVDTMKNYRDDMAIRNMARDTLLATMRSTDIATAMKLVAYNDKATLKGDSAATLQVDWKTTKENLKEFALRLSATTEVIDAYKKGLEDELDVYQQLIVAGITQGESQDANQQKFITTKQLAKMRLSNAQLVNAFGDTVETVSGTKYGINEVYFDEQGKMFDKMGNEITEQVKVTSNLSKFIESELPRIRKELLDASIQSANNKEFSRRLQEALPGILAGRLDTSTQYRGVLADYLRNNESYFIEQFNTIWKDIYNEAITNDRYKDILNGRSEKDALTAAINATPETIKWLEDKGASGLAYDTRLMAELLDKALIRIEKEGAGSLGVGAEGESYRGVYNLIMNYLKRQEYDTAVIKRYSQLMGTDTSNSLSLTAYADQGGIGGVRGQKARMLRDAFGLEKGYDLESLYERARTGGQFRMSQNRLEYLKEKYGTTAQSHIAGDTVQWNNGELDNADATLKNMVEEVIRMSEASKDIRDTFRELGSEMHSILADFGKGSWEAPFEKMGESLVLGEQASESLDDVYKNLAAELLQASGAAMTKAGWELVARGAADKNYAMIAGGLALAGAGAFAAGIGTGMNQEDKESKEAEDKAKRLEALKNNLADLLRQAREDAIYYENTLRHKKAISAADELTTRSVHDAIITPRGDVVTTDPKDYLIATKTPRTLVGGGAPTINFSVVDKSTGVRVTQQRSSYDEATNTIDFEAIIESKVAEVIASPKGDDAFNAREARLRGRSVIA